MRTAALTRFSVALLVVISALTMGTLLFATPAAAVTIVPDCARKQTTKAPDLDCVLETFENIANLLLGLTGSFALLMFVYGGFTLLSSGGSEEKVTKGKTIIRNSVIGIFIIMLSGYMIRYAIVSVRGEGTLQQAAEACDDVKVDGKMVTPRVYTVDNELICAHSCTQIPGYSCTTETAGKHCLVGLCIGTQNRRCCPN